MNAQFGGVVARVRSGKLARDLAFVAVLAIIGVIAVRPALSGEGETLANTQVLASVCGITVAAAGLNLLAGYARLLSLGQGAFFAIGAYTSAYLTLDKGMNPFLAMGVAMAGAAVAGIILAVASMRLRGPAFAMITLVVAILVEQVLVEWAPLGRLSGYPNTLDHGSGLLEPIAVFGNELDPPLFAGMSADVLVAIVVVLVVALVGYRNVAQSSWGRSLRAIGTSEHLAAHLGVNVFARKVAVMAVAAVYGALGGIFYVQAFAHLQPESFNILLSITIILAVILGGQGMVLGPIVGSIVIVVLQRTDVLQPLVDAQRQVNESWYLSTPGLIGLLLILTLAFLPRGIMGGVEFVIHRLTRRASDSGLSREKSAQGTSKLQSASAPASPHESASEQVLLDVRSVQKNFGGIAAVGGVDLSAESGKILALIGPNGAGKSTMANLITGVYAVDQGEIIYDGHRIDRLPTHKIARRGIARTFQTPLLFSHETVEENVLSGFPDTGVLPFWRAWLKLPGQYRRGAQMQARTKELLELVNLTGAEHVEAGNLSYGKQRALEIARALASEPQLLILDEPAAGLNTAETSELAQLLLLLRSRGLSMVVVEHHMDLVTTVADTVTCMNSGVVLAQGSAADVLADPAVIEAYLGVQTEEKS